jgi:deoxyribonuclease IV
VRFGAHVPTHGRPAGAIDSALARGCDAFQIFASNPRAWAAPRLDEERAEEFRRRRAESGLGPAFAHSSYLVNIASPDEAFRLRSIALARAELEVVEALGADGLVVHAGAGGPGERPHAVARAADSVHRVLGDGPGPSVLLELTAGGAGTVGSTIPQAAELFEALGRHPRALLCLDTCHLFAAGYGLDTPEGVAELTDQLHRYGLVDRLRLVHANDARDPRGSRRDRHEHPGQGYLGEAGFRATLARPELRDAAVLVETRGKTEEHRRDVETLRRLAGCPPRPGGKDPTDLGPP